MLLSLLRLTRWQGRRLAVSLLILAYAWAFVALDITHTHATALAQTVYGLSRAPSAAPPGHAVLTHQTAGAPEATCLICAAVHAAAVALVQAPAPVRALAPVRLFVVRPPSFASTGHSSTLHLRGPPQA